LDTGAFKTFINSTAFTKEFSRKKETYILSPRQPHQRTSQLQKGQFLCHQVAKDSFDLIAAIVEF
jgi:hypothetical protein